MKKLILVALLTTSAFSGFFNNNSNVEKELAEQERLCEIFTDKVIDYAETMRNDTMAYATLSSYKDRAVAYCSKAESLKASQIASEKLVTESLQSLEKK